MRASQFLIVASVLASGLIAALPFRHPRAPATDSTSRLPPLELTLRRPDDTYHARATAGVSPAVGLDAINSDVSVDSDGAAHLSRSTDLTAVVPLPALPIAFEPARTADSQAKNDWRPGPALTALFRRGPESQLKPRTYRIRDGDTLENIAERFLGSRERAEEIFAKNAGTLKQPDLLPVGITIMLPPRADGSNEGLTGAER